MQCEQDAKVALFVSFEIKGLLLTNAESVIFIMYVNMVELCQTKILLDALTLGYTANIYSF